MSSFVGKGGGGASETKRGGWRAGGPPPSGSRSGERARASAHARERWRDRGGAQAAVAEGVSADGASACFHTARSLIAIRCATATIATFFWSAVGDGPAIR